MGTSRIDLINRAIPKAFRGYDRLAVDRLVQDLSDALARATDERVALSAKVKELEARIAEHKEREAALQDALVSARRMGDEIRETAQKEAQLILEKARIKADGLLQNARARLARLMEEAAGARKAKVQFEMKLRSAIGEHLRLLEMDKLESAGIEAAMRKMAPSPIDGADKGGS